MIGDQRRRRLTSGMRSSGSTSKGEIVRSSTPHSAGKSPKEPLGESRNELFNVSLQEGPVSREGQAGPRRLRE